MTPGSRIVAVVPSAATNQIRESRRRAAQVKPQQKQSVWNRWLGEPRNTVFLVLAGALTIGGGRKLLQWWRARSVVARLGEPNLTVEAVEAAANHGRAPLMELFRLLTTADSGPIQHAAGRAIATLWAQDNLIVEEEKALVLRGFTATWHARRRYPRQIHAPIPITISYGVPFLTHDQQGQGIGPESLEWSHRISGTRRATYETATPWQAGAALAELELIPDDFETNGPHRLVLHPRVRTRSLTDTWELDLPQIPFHLEFDPVLAPEALFTLADSARGEELARAVRIESSVPDDSPTPAYLPLNPSFALRNAPAVLVETPLPCDLAHKLEIEIEGLEGRFPAGHLILSGQGVGRIAPSLIRRFPIGPIDPLPETAIDRPGTRRIRAILTPAPDRGWGEPDIRSIWPGTLETEWANVEVIRR